MVDRERGRHVIWELATALRRIETAHAVECGHYPAAVAVFAGRSLYDTVWKWNHDEMRMLWKFDLLTGELYLAGIRSQVTVVRAPASDFDEWGFTVVIGAAHAGGVSPVGG